jgi:hypothetical protein
MEEKKFLNWFKTNKIRLIQKFPQLQWETTTHLNCIIEINSILLY